jgi:hypothetical protein
MQILNSLKQLFGLKIDAKAAENLRSIKLVDITNSGTKNVYKNKVSVNIQQLTIHVDKEDRNVKEQLQTAIRSAVQDGVPVLEEQFSGRAEKYVLYSGNEPDILQELLKELASQDGLLLKAAFYLRDVHRQGGNVSELKRDIIDRYGERGRTVTNLCSAGYFETVIKPMLDELRAQPGYTSRVFQERFDSIVASYPFAVFVGITSTVGSVSKEIIQKIKTNRRYGIHHLKLHAIGRSNSIVAQKVLEIDEVRCELSREPITTIVNNIFAAEIFF